MKILIMVLSYREHTYRELMKAQQETWASVKDKDVDTVFYMGGSYAGHVTKFGAYDPIVIESQFQCTDEYYYMAAKFKMALEYYKNWGYDIIFRTNSSSYVNKQKLKEFANTLPPEKLYAGWTFPDLNDHSGLCVSGAGIFLSRDTAEILREKIDPEFEMEEDVYCGRILRANGITALTDKSRYDVTSISFNVPTDRYHYRFKTDDRLRDANNMRELHQKIIK